MTYNTLNEITLEKSLINMKLVPTLLLIRLCAVILIAVITTPLYAEDYQASSASIEIPPNSLEQWYKPANKRQVWLHTMFRLRREMQAISEYATLNDQTALSKWIKRLDKDYRKIVEMVPEWKKEIKPRLIAELEMFAEKGDYSRIEKTLKMIERTCDDCHTTYQPLVTAMYRSPGYDDIKVNNINGVPHGFNDNMKDLSASVNRILIALDDGYKSRALHVSKTLSKQLQNLGDSCNACHENDAYPRERILGKATQKNIETLQADISAGRVKDSQELMGKIAVTVCARCHNTHRIVYDLRGALMPED